MNTELKAHYLQVLSIVKIADQINDTFYTDSVFTNNFNCPGCINASNSPLEKGQITDLTLVSQ